MKWWDPVVVRSRGRSALMPTHLIAGTPYTPLWPSLRSGNDHRSHLHMQKQGPSRGEVTGNLVMEQVAVTLSFSPFQGSVWANTHGWVSQPYPFLLPQTLWVSPLQGRVGGWSITAFFLWRQAILTGRGTEYCLMSAGSLPSMPPRHFYRWILIIPP